MNKEQHQETVMLYTRQNEKTLLQFERDGRLINNKSYIGLHFGNIAPLFLESYDWFTKMASRMVPKPDDVDVPIWCAISENTCLPLIPGTIIYVLEVPKSIVIYFDDVKWDYVLNHHYLPKDATDHKAYNDRLDSIGVSNGFEFFEGRYAGKYPEEVRLIKDSWSRIFDVSHAEDWTNSSICGNIWEIKKEWVREIRKI